MKTMEERLLGQIAENEERISRQKEEIQASNAATMMTIPSLPAEQAGQATNALAFSDILAEPFVATQAKPQMLYKGKAYTDLETGKIGIWKATTANCGDPAWKPGGAAYANWQMIPTIAADGHPIWEMGVYVEQGSKWHDNGKLWKCNKNITANVNAPHTDASSWTEVPE